MIAMLGAALGATVAVGALFVYRGLFPARSDLASLASALSGTADDRSEGRPSAGVWWLEELEARASGTAVADREADLAVLERSMSRWRWRRLWWMVCVGLVPALVGGLTIGLSGAAPPIGPLLAGTVAAVGAGWWLAGFELRSEADGARKTMRHAVALYLDLAAVAMAGGAGPAEAMRTAARHGHGAEFRRIRTVLATAEVQQRSPYDALEELGRRLAVPELAEVGSAMALADEKGAPIRSTLDTKARSVAFRLMNTEEAEAEARSVTMSLPSVLMLSGFLLFLMYPFVAALVATTG